MCVYASVSASESVYAPSSLYLSVYARAHVYVCPYLCTKVRILVSTCNCVCRAGFVGCPFVKWFVGRNGIPRSFERSEKENLTRPCSSLTRLCAPFARPQKSNIL